MSSSISGGPLTSSTGFSSSGQYTSSDATQSVQKLWIPGAAFGPFDIVDGGDEIGEFGGANAEDSAVMTYIMPIPWDLDVTAAITFTDYLVFDGVSDGDVFEIDHLFTIVETDATTDPVHVAPSTAFDDEDGALTIVEATHESRIYVAGAAQIDADTITTAQQTDRDLLVLGWEINLTTMAENEFVLLGTEMSYTRRFL